MYSCGSDVLEAPWQHADFITISAPASSPSPSTSLLPKTFGFSAITRINPIFVEESSVNINIDNNEGDKVDETEITSSEVVAAATVTTDDTVQELGDPSLFTRSVLVSVRVCRESRRCCGGLAPAHVGVQRSQCSAECLLLPGRSRRRINVEKSSALRVISQSNEIESSLAVATPVTAAAHLRPNLRLYQNQHQRQSQRQNQLQRYRHRCTAILCKERNCCRDPSHELSAVTNSRASVSTSLPEHIALRCLRYKIDRCLRNAKSATWPPMTPPSQLSPGNCADALITFCRTYDLIGDGAYHRKSRYRCRHKHEENGCTRAWDTLDISRLHRHRVQRYSGKFAHCASDEHFWKAQPQPQSPPSPASSFLSFSSSASTSGFSDASASVSMPNSSISSQAAVAVLASTNDRFKVENLTPRSQFSFGMFRDDLVLPNPNSTCLQFPHCQEIGIVRTDANSVRLPTPQLQSPSYSGRQGPDFTLDAQQAEKVVQKLKNRKRRRCWCQIAMCCIGFAFLLFSVMLFSMALTRGEKLFGPLRSIY